MQEHHDDHEWVNDAERWICQIQGVRQCKIDLDAEGAITGVHVVATPDREPRMIVRDVEGLMKARLNVEVFYKKIGVVQILDPDPTEPVRPDPTPRSKPETERPSAAPRPRQEAARPKAAPSKAAHTEAARPEPQRRMAPPVDDAPQLRPIVHPAVLVEESPQARVECAGVALESRGPALRAAVTLEMGELTARCEEEGPNHPGMESQLLGRATLKALQDLLDEPVTLSLAELRESELAGERLTMAAIDLVEGRRTERFFGCCSQRHNAREANVFAVLDALNRRLSLFNFKEEPVKSGV